MNHTLSLKDLDPKVLIVKSFKICSNHLEFSWCLTHVERMFVDEEMPLSFLPFLGLFFVVPQCTPHFLVEMGTPLL